MFLGFCVKNLLFRIMEPLKHKSPVRTYDKSRDWWQGLRHSTFIAEVVRPWTLYNENIRSRLQPMKESFT